MNKKNLRLLIYLILASVAMLCLAYAAVPLYSLFCKTTGYGGAPKRVASYVHYKPGNRVITVRFNADLSPELNWKFAPLVSSTQAKVGTNVLTFYNVENLTQLSSRGIAIYNVTPEKAAKYFNKVACFCFEEQLILPYQKVVMPVSFFIDPALEEDEELKNLTTITLSYTFFKYLY